MPITEILILLSPSQRMHAHAGSGVIAESVFQLCEQVHRLVEKDHNRCARGFVRRGNFRELRRPLPGGGRGQKAQPCDAKAHSCDAKVHLCDAKAHSCDARTSGSCAGRFPADGEHTKTQPCDATAHSRDAKSHSCDAKIA